MKRYLFLFGLTLIFSGCKYEQKDDNQSVIKKNPVQVQAKIVQTKVTPSTISTAGVWEDGDLVGMYIINDNGYKTSNVQYKSNASGIFTSNVGMFYDSYSAHKIFGYYPYNISAPGDPATLYEFAVLKDQSTKVGYTSSDLMHDVIANQVPQLATDNKVNMEFKHKMSNVRVKLRNDRATPFIGPDAPVVKIVGTNTSSKLDLITGTISQNSTKKVEDIVMMLVTPYSVGVSSELEYVAVAVPQKIAAQTQLFHIEIAGGETPATYAVTVASEFELGSGFEHEFVVTNKGVPVIIGGGEVKPWTVGATATTQAGGDGMRPSLLTFTFTNAIANIENATSVEITVDGVAYSSLTAAWNTTDSKLVITYDQGANWGYVVNKIVIKDASGAVIKTKDGLTKDILGDPTSDGYNKVINIE